MPAYPTTYATVMPPAVSTFYLNNKSEENKTQDPLSDDLSQWMSLQAQIADLKPDALEQLKSFIESLDEQKPSQAIEN